ncbi:type II toxin-antitoxin system HicB family antitoxin [Rudanella paleaurantiibacter]|uniref:Type II toxin-antitoxin system HicB family antitoxin n=1 Tax=Rudanella paleaurantiibacter TaxID=2614655 RepID=A0A7J5TV40_9BACT|nr:type II toxin-antitoxin system HicB family antitoxin [Rudanella paleaurantiibacter]KAB7728015.1 type II toxin-antitoxin system HicB family antitoxin [Rudanella paleaurantiibacter]
MADHKHTLTIVFERDDGELWGRVETPEFLHTTVGTSVEEVAQNLRDLVEDFLENEGKDAPEWSGVKIEDISFNYEYDLTALFEVFSSVKIGSIADAAGINQSLMRQYASGKKNPSERQAKKIEEAVRQLGQRLTQVVIA